jgi:hypothetical protein
MKKNYSYLNIYTSDWLDICIFEIKMINFETNMIRNYN